MTEERMRRLFPRLGIKMNGKRKAHKPTGNAARRFMAPDSVPVMIVRSKDRAF